jgi:hypothetical protein
MMKVFNQKYMYTALTCALLASQTIASNNNDGDFASQLKSLQEGFAREKVAMDKMSAQLKRSGWALQDLRDGGARLNGLVYEAIRNIPTDETKRTQIEQLARTIFENTWVRTGQKPMDVYKELMTCLAEIRHHPSPHFYQCQDDKGRVLYLLGCQHEYPMLSLHPEAVKILMTLNSCWIEVKQDKEDLRQLIGELKACGLTSTTDDWLHLLPAQYQEVMKTRLQKAETQGLDLASAHPVFILQAMQEWGGSSSTNPIEQELLMMSVEEELTKAFEASGKPIHALENETTRAVDSDLVQFLLNKSKEQSFETICHKIESLLRRDSAPYKSWRQLEGEREEIRDSLRHLLYHHFDVDLSPDYENQEMKNRNLRWQKILLEALAKGEFDQPRGICPGNAHLHLSTGLFKFYASLGFKILRMDSTGAFSLPVQLEE